MEKEAEGRCRGLKLLKHIISILALLITTAAADVRSEGQTDGHVAWPNSITSVEQCHRRVGEIVAKRGGFTDARAEPNPVDGHTVLWVKDRARHFIVSFTCGLKERTVFIVVLGWSGQTGSAADLFDELAGSFTAPHQ